MYVYEIDLLTTFKLFENFLLLLYGFWPYSQRRAIVVFMYNLFETFSHFGPMNALRMHCLFLNSNILSRDRLKSLVLLVNFAATLLY